MSDPDKPDDIRPSRADVDDIADASLGFDTRIFGTLRDTFIRTPDVVASAYAGDRDRYVPIIRFFLVLFGLQFALMAFADLPTGFSLASLETSPDTQIAVEQWIAAGPDCAPMLDGLDGDARLEAYQACRAAVELTLDRLNSFTTAPLAFLSTIPFLILLKLYAVRRSFFGHLLAYLAATNSSYIVLFPFLALAVFVPGQTLFWSGFLLSVIWYFVAMGRILYRFYSQKVWVVSLQILGQIAMLPVMFILLAIMQLLLVHIAVSAAHDLSIVELMAIDAGITPEDVAP